MAKIDIRKRNQGDVGEEMAKQLLIKSPETDFFFQGDWIVKRENGTWYSVEVKHQDYFESPPFDGHGLPPYQVKSRLSLYEKYGIRALLLVFDSKTNKIYCQWIDKLEEGDRKDTNSEDPRRVYPLKSFNEIGSFDGNHKLHLK